jgi:hypothetical protein
MLAVPLLWLDDYRVAEVELPILQRQDLGARKLDPSHPSRNISF